MTYCSACHTFFVQTHNRPHSAVSVMEEEQKKLQREKRRQESPPSPTSPSKKQKTGTVLVTLSHYVADEGPESMLQIVDEERETTDTGTFTSPC
jgi:hypothetical protein